MGLHWAICVTFRRSQLHTSWKEKHLFWDKTNPKHLPFFCNHFWSSNLPKFDVAMNSSISSSSESSMRGVKAYLRVGKARMSDNIRWNKCFKNVFKCLKKKGAACLWLVADGLHKNIMTNRMTENKNLQKASSTHSSIQSFFFFFF